MAQVTAYLSYTWVRRRRWASPLEDIVEKVAGEKKNVPHSNTDVEEENHRIQKAILSLPLHQRAVVTMYYLNEMSLQEIAEILNIPMVTDKSTLHFGRRLLKKHLGLRGDMLSEAHYEFT